MYIRLFLDFGEVYVGHTELCVHLSSSGKKELMHIHAHREPAAVTAAALNTEQTDLIKL